MKSNNVRKNEYSKYWTSEGRSFQVCTKCLKAHPCINKIIQKHCGVGSKLCDGSMQKMLIPAKKQKIYNTQKTIWDGLQRKWVPI